MSRELKAWCARCLTTEGGKGKRLSKMRLSAEVQGALEPMVLDTWHMEKDESGYEPDDLAQELVDRAEEDQSTALDERPRRYVVSAFFGEEREPKSSQEFQLKPRKDGFKMMTALPSGGEVLELKAGMNHLGPDITGARAISENQMVFSAIMQRTYGHLSQENERLHDRVHVLEGENTTLRTQMFELFERRSEREAELRAQERAEQRAIEDRKEVFSMVNKAWTMFQVQQRSNVRSLPLPNKTKEAIDPMLLRIGRLLASLDEKESSALADCLKEQKQAEFIEIYLELAQQVQPYLEAEEAAKAS